MTLRNYVAPSSANDGLGPKSAIQSTAKLKSEEEAFSDQAKGTEFVPLESIQYERPCARSFGFCRTSKPWTAQHRVQLPRRIRPALNGIASCIQRSGRPLRGQLQRLVLRLPSMILLQVG